MATSKKEQETDLLLTQYAFMDIHQQVLAAMRLPNMDALLELFITSGYKHIMALKVINQRHFCDECKHMMLEVPKDKFMVNANSKRSVHQALYWIRLLGPHFPINDFLLNHPLLRNHLDHLCDYGVHTFNGHSRNKFRVCINPTHYSLELGVIQEILYENLEIIQENFDILQASDVFQAFITHINSIKHTINIVNVIDIIRWQCPPVHSGFPEFNLVDWNILNYKVLIADFDVNAFSRILYNQSTSHHQFEHYCDSHPIPAILPTSALTPVLTPVLAPAHTPTVLPLEQSNSANEAFIAATTIKVIKGGIFKPQKRGIYHFPSIRDTATILVALKNSRVPVAPVSVTRQVIEVNDDNDGEPILVIS